MKYVRCESELHGKEKKINCTVLAKLFHIVTVITAGEIKKKDIEDRIGELKIVVISGDTIPKCKNYIKKKEVILHFIVFIIQTELNQENKNKTLSGFRHLFLHLLFPSNYV